MHPQLHIAISAARRAARVITRSLDRPDTIVVQEKGNHDFVTDIDQAAEAEIIQVIRTAYPDHTIIAEETGITQEGHEYVWIIDPLDGTTNFIHGFPQFAISIAMARQGKLEIGLVYDPLKDELFTATRGQGARLNNRRIRVSHCQQLKDALIGTGFPYKEDQFQTYLQQFGAVLPVAAGIRRAGSAALDLAYLAAGRLDGFWESNLQYWDIAAGVLLIQEAGGLVTDFTGEKAFVEKRQLVAGTPKVHPLLRELISTHSG
ncbi:MAG: inositol monophosphatase [Gammaproteobacteria bacterium RIFCSPHIGHO2_12_FULL_45_9]|nr:MAG: inositol monophosphatase [Gammaproteobacteria bacterium RIFCSPHIGHO2_12_FULL_45_9]